MSLDNELGTSFFRVPPDGAGKKLQAYLYHVVDFADSTHTFKVGDYIYGVTSGEVGEVVSVEQEGPSSGVLWLTQEEGGTGNGFTAGERLRHGGIEVANVVECSIRHTQAVQLSGRNNPNYGQYVDNQGAAFIRFAEGAPLFGPFGAMKVGQQSVLGVYEHSTDEYRDLISTITANGGNAVYHPENSEVVLQVTGANGSKCVRQTNRYHYYLPGTGQTIMMTAACGDSGKANCVRRWGYFDDDDGYFFELDGTTFSVVLRSSMGGVVTEKRVTQVEMNGDRLDGEGLSGVVYDPSKYWVYFMDMQWLGAGRVRLGVASDAGARVICHEFRNSGHNTSLYMTRGSLPLRWEIFNKGATAGTSEFKEGCAALYAEQPPNYAYWHHSDMRTDGLRTVGATPLPALSFQSKATLPDGRHNHVTAYPETLSVYVKGTSPVRISMVEAHGVADVLVGATWNIPGHSSIIGDNTATAVNDPSDKNFFHPSWSGYVDPGVTRIDLRQYFADNDDGIDYHPDGSFNPWIFLVEKLDQAGTAEVDLTLVYRELY